MMLVLEMVSGETVCVWDVECEGGVECCKFLGESGKFLGKGKGGIVGIVGGGGIWGRAREKKTGAGVWCLVRTMQNTCGMSTGDNGCGALSWKRESGRLASFKVVESRARHLCVGSGK